MLGNANPPNFDHLPSLCHDFDHFLLENGSGCNTFLTSYPFVALHNYDLNDLSIRLNAKLELETILTSLNSELRYILYVIPFVSLQILI